MIDRHTFSNSPPFLCCCRLLLWLVLALSGGAIGANDSGPESSSEPVAELFQFNARLSLQWYEASPKCLLKKGPQNYFLVQTNLATDSIYVNAPLSNIVRSDNEGASLFMAKRCSVKPAWFIYDFDDQKYLAEDLRFGEAEDAWLSLGNKPIRIVKASRPDRHLEPVFQKPRLPSPDQWIKLGAMLFAPVLATLLFLSILSLSALYRFRASGSSADLRRVSVAVGIWLLVAIPLLSFVSYVILRY